MEPNDNYENLIDQAKDFEGLEPEEEITNLSGAETDSPSECEWSEPEGLAQMDYPFIADAADPINLSLAEVLGKLLQ